MEMLKRETILKENSEQKVQDEKKYKHFISETYKANMHMHEEQKRDHLTKIREDEKRKIEKI